MKYITIITLLTLLSGCGVETLVSPEQLPATENAMFTDDGRLFVAAQTQKNNDESWAIIEVVKNGSEYTYKPYVKGTTLGSISGKVNDYENAAGEPCRFAGLNTKGNDIYAICLQNGDSIEAATLFRVDTRAGTVQTGLMTKENARDKDGNNTDFDLGNFMGNGMDIDNQGRVYISNSRAGVLGGFANDTIHQIHIDESASSSSNLSFTHHVWLSDVHIFPNGIQILNDVLYYVTDRAIRKVKITSNGEAGERRHHYSGNLIDDFDIASDGSIAMAQILPPAIKHLKPAPFNKRARVKKYTSLGIDKVPSSIAYVPASLDQYRNRGVKNVIFTSFFFGGVHRSGEKM